jgi:hypothetical protein
MKLTLTELSRCTGFPPQTLKDFANRGLLPSSHSGSNSQTFNGLALLSALEGVLSVH